MKYSGPVLKLRRGGQVKSSQPEETYAPKKINKEVKEITLFTE